MENYPWHVFVALCACTSRQIATYARRAPSSIGVTGWCCPNGVHLDESDVGRVDTAAVVAVKVEPGHVAEGTLA